MLVCVQKVEKLSFDQSKEILVQHFLYDWFHLVSANNLHLPTGSGHAFFPCEVAARLQTGFLVCETEK